MQNAAEPTIALPDPAARIVPFAKPEKADLQGRKPPRYAPERGLVRRIRTAQANDDIGALAVRHDLDEATRASLAAELIKAGAPPITPANATTALARLVQFDPLNADALRPFLLLCPDRSIRAQAMAQVGGAMRRAGRSVRLVSDAVDTHENPVLVEAGKRLGCGVTRYDGSPNCVSVLKETDLACLALIEAGFRAPLDRVALLRLNTLVQATGSEPVLVIRPEDAPLATALSKIGVKRVVLVNTESDVVLGPVFTALRDANLAIAEIMDMRDDKPSLRPANASGLAALLTE